MAKLTANVVVTDPETGQPTVLLAGDDLPTWAGDLVGDHALADEKPKPRTTTSK